MDININQPLFWKPKKWKPKKGYYLYSEEKIIGEFGQVKGLKQQSFIATPNLSLMIERAGNWTGETSVFIQTTGEEIAFLERRFKTTYLLLKNYPEIHLVFKRRGILTKEWFWEDEITGKPLVGFTPKGFFSHTYEVEVLRAADALPPSVWEMLLSLGLYLIVKIGRK